jgi:hypothetical protein
MRLCREDRALWVGGGLEHRANAEAQEVAPADPAREKQEATRPGAQPSLSAETGLKLQKVGSAARVKKEALNTKTVEHL